MIRKKTQNKKVKNATKVEIDGITFRSQLEAYTYKNLKEAEIDVEYEKHRYTILAPFVYNCEKVRAMTYLPDFVGDGFIIECKGYATDAWRLRKKIVMYYLSTNEPDTIFYVVSTQKNVDALIDTLKQQKNNKICQQNL